MKNSIFFLLLLIPVVLRAQHFNPSQLDSVSELAHKQHSLGSIINKSTLYIGPAVMFGFGLLANKNNYLQRINLQIREEVLEERRTIHAKTEDVLQYIPVQAVFALTMVGLKSRNNFIDRAFLYGLSNTIMSQSVDKLKTATRELRPNGSDYRSFPSGHTATAFSAAEFMRLEYKENSPVYGIAAYAIAATTGALRIYHNKHWFSDVVAGAGVGILSTDIAYFVYPKVKKFVIHKIGLKTNNLHIGPAYQHKSFGLGLIYNPK